MDLCKIHSCPFSHIGDMDKTPMYVNLHSNNRVDSVGTKTVASKTPGYEKPCLTLLVACMADAVGLSLVILKCRIMPKERFPLVLLLSMCT